MDKLVCSMCRRELELAEPRYEGDTINLGYYTCPEHPGARIVVVRDDDVDESDSDGLD